MAKTIKINRMTMRRREILTGLLFISPWLIGVSAFFLRNLFQTANYSLSRINILEQGGYTLTNVGLSNYRSALIENVNFNQQLITSIINMLINVPMIIFFSLFMAILLNRNFAFRTGIRAIFFLPIIMATAAITGALDQVMRLMMGGVSSIPPELANQQGINPAALMSFLVSFGLPAQLSTYILNILNNIYEVIRASGVQIIIFLAALQSIPTSLYEVAQIEGATSYEIFWKITFPMVSPLILTNVVYTIVDAYSQSEVVTLAHTAAFGGRADFGLSAAMTITSTAAACLFLFIVGYAVSRYVYYQN